MRISVLNFGGRPRLAGFAGILPGNGQTICSSLWMGTLFSSTRDLVSMGKLEGSICSGLFRFLLTFYFVGGSFYISESLRFEGPTMPPYCWVEKTFTSGVYSLAGWETARFVKRGNYPTT